MDTSSSALHYGHYYPHSPPPPPPHPVKEVSIVDIQVPPVPILDFGIYEPFVDFIVGIVGVYMTIMYIIYYTYVFPSYLDLRKGKGRSRPKVKQLSSNLTSSESDPTLTDLSARVTSAVDVHEAL